MAAHRFTDRGFTLLEALFALMVLGVVVVVGLETIGLAAAARARAGEYAILREVAEARLAEISSASGADIRRMSGSASGTVTIDDREIVWRRQVTELEDGSGLFRVELEIEHAGTRLRVSTNVNRFGELWRRELAAGE